MASVDFMAQKVYVDCDGATLEKVKEVCNDFEEVKVVEEAPAPLFRALRARKLLKLPAYLRNRP